MYELDGVEYSLETLQNKAQEYGMEFDAYMQTMTEKGLVEKAKGAVEVDATAAPQPVSEDTGSASGDGSLESEGSSWINTGIETLAGIIAPEIVPLLKAKDVYDWATAAEPAKQYPTLDYASDVVHPDVSAFNEAEAGGSLGFLQMEGNIVDMFNKHYSEVNPGLDIRFSEAKAGRDAVELLIGDQEPGEGEVFDLQSDFGLGLAQGWAEFRGKGDETFTNEGVFNAIKTTINNAVNKDSRASTVDMVLDNIDNAKLDLTDNPQNKTAFLNSLDEQSGGVAINRKVGEGGSNVLEGPIWALSGFNMDRTNVNMEGYLTMTDPETGEETGRVPYKYIWDNRKMFAEEYEKRSMSVHGDARRSEHGDLVYRLDPNNLLTGVEADELAEFENREMEGVLIDDDPSIAAILSDAKAIKELKDAGETTEELEEVLKEKLEKRGVKPLYNAEGFLDIERTVEAVQASETDEDIDAQLLADDHPVSVLAEMQHDRITRLLHQAEVALANREDVESEIPWVQKTVGLAMDLGFAAGGIPMPSAKPESITFDIEQLERIVEQGNLLGVRLPELAGNSPSARKFNATVKELKTISRALALNSDPSRLERDNFLVEKFDDVIAAFAGGERVIKDFTRNDEVEAFSYIMEEAGYTIPEREAIYTVPGTKQLGFGEVDEKTGEAKGWKTSITLDPREISLAGTLTNTRRAVEATSNVVTDMGPLLLELYIFKKVSPGFMAGKGSAVRNIEASLLRSGRKTSQRLTSAFTKNRPGASTTLPESYRWLTKNVVAPGVATTAEWAIAESVGEHTMGWKAQTIDYETGETRFTFPFAMGASGTVFKHLQNSLWTNIKAKAPKLHGRLEAVSTSTVKSSNLRKVLQPHANFAGRAVGQGLTATSLLTVAEAVQMNIDSLLEKGEFSSAEQWKDLFDPKHFLTTWAAMSVLSGRKILPEYRRHVEESILLMDNQTRASKDAAEALGVDSKSYRRKDGGFHQSKVDRSSKSKLGAIDKVTTKEKQGIDKEVNKEVEKIQKDSKLNRRQKNKKSNKAKRRGEEQKRKIDAEAQKKKQPIINAARALKAHNDLILTQKSIKSGKAWREYLRGETKKFDILRKRDLTNEEREEFAKLDHGDMQEMLYMKGYEPGSNMYEYHMQEHAILKEFTAYANGARFSPTGELVTPYSKANPAARRKFIQDAIDTWKNQAKIEALKQEVKDNPGDTSIKVKNKARIKSLEETQKTLEEKMETNSKEYEEWVEKRIEAEIATGKIIAEKLGADGEYRVLSEAEYKNEMLSRFDDTKEGRRAAKEAAGSEGLYDPKTGDIILNREAMKKMVSLGAPVHELMHRVLKESLKTKNKNGDKVISREGKKIIDQFLSELSKKDRAVLEERIEKNYKYQDFSQKQWDSLSAKKKAMYKKPEGVGGQLRAEFKKEYYYEEYITAYGQALKEGDIVYSKPTVPPGIGRLFYGVLKGSAPNLETRSIKSGKELHDLIIDMHETSEAIRQKIEAGQAIESAAATAERLKLTGKKTSGEGKAAESRKRIKKGVKVETRLEQGVNSLAEGKKTKAEWLERKTQNAAVDATKAGGVINNYIKGKGLSPGEFKETIESVRGRLKNFDPEAKRKTDSKEPITLLEFVNSNIKYGRLDAKKALYKKSVDIFETAKDIDAKTSEGVDRYQPKAETESRVTKFEEADMSMAAQAKRRKQKAEGKPEVEGPKSKFKELVLKNNALANPNASSAKLTNKFRAAVQSALKSAGPAGATAKGKPFLFRDKIEKSFENDMFKSVKDSFGTRKVYEEFIKSDATFDAMKDMPIRQLTKAKMDFAYEPVLDASGKQVRMNAQEMVEAGYPESYDKAVGPPKWKRKNFTKQDFIDWAQGKGRSGSTQGTRKDALARMIAIETAKDAVPIALSKPFVQAYDVNGNPRMFDGKPVTVDILKDLSTQQKVELAESALKAKVLDVINRDPNIQFSLKKKAAAFEKEMEGKSIMEQVYELSKPEHREIKKYYDKESNRIWGMDYETKAIKIEQEIWADYTMHELEYARAEEVLSGEQLKELTELANNSVTEANFKDVLKKFNKENGTNIPADSQKFAFGTEGKVARENFFKRQGDIYDLLPAGFFNSSKMVTALFKTGGLGSLAVRERIDHFEKEILEYGKSVFKLTKGKEVYDSANLKSMSNKELLELAETMKDLDVFRPVQKVADQMIMAGAKNQGAWRNDLIKAIEKQGKTAYQSGTDLVNKWRNGSPEVKKQIEKEAGVKFKYGVKQKLAPRGKDGDLKFMVDNFGRPLKGNASIEVPMIKDAKGNLRPLTDAWHIANISSFKSNKVSKAGGRVQFEKANKRLRENNISLYNQRLAEWSRKQLSAKGFTYEQTEQANKYVRETLIKALVEYVYAPKLSAKEFAARAEAVHKFLQIQTNIGEGLIKGLNTIRYVTNQPPTPSKYSPTGYHAEHAYFNLAHTASFSHILSKHKKSGSVKDFMKDYEGISSNMEQFLIQESTRQGNEGRQADGTIYGNTEFFKGGNVFSKLNVLSSNPKVAFELVDLKSSTGKTIGETLSKDLKLGEAEGVVFARQLGKNLNLVKQGEKAFNKVESELSKQLDNVPGFKMSKKKMTFEEKTDAIRMVNKALANGRRTDGKKNGMSTFDFDETLIVKGENFVTATKGKKTIKISSENFPLEGPKLEAEGYKFDFKDFVNVKGGVEGPLFKKLQKQIAKYGSENVFVLTARQMEAAPAIHAWLKSKGVELPIENITGLGESAGEAKGRWMLEKFSEGYNDMYFVDDAMPNVKAVKKVLDQLDIKSDVQQVRFSKKQKLDADVNDIMEHSLGIESKKRFSKAEGRMRGKDARRRKLFVPDTAADLDLLLEPLYGRGKQGIKNKEWFQENFYKKFERGINDFNTAKQRLTTEYMTLRKGNKDVVKDLGKEVPETSFTHDQAMRVYIWNKAGFKIPDLASTTQQKLVDYISNSPKHRAYAESLSRMTGVETGLKEPTANWWAETIATEITDVNRSVGRKEHLADFIETRKEIFSEENLNKMESKLGKNWRDTIEDMFDRMETGRTRAENLSEGTGALLNYFNGSVGTIMNFNTRSGLLQLISSVNFINSSFNNPARAAQAFANQPQYWKDFMRIMNSDMLKQRRNGLEINVTEAEIATAAKNSKNPAQAVIAKILKAGYLPTKIADSFAIASGGATYYRNAVRKYTKEGMSKVEAEKKAFLDFQALAERTQQSSRPDLISKQQTTLGGRVILPFANTPMQMNRLALKEMLDIGKGRYKNSAEFADKLGKIGYYGFIQTAIFAGLQSAAFAIFANSDDDDLKAKKKTQMLDTMLDSSLRGMGIKGAVLNGVINAGKEFFTQREKDYGADYSEVAEDLLSISPPIGSKFRKLDAAGNTYKYNKKQIEEEGIEFSLDSPGLQATTQVVEAVANIPANRVFKKLNNLKNAADTDYATWERFLMALGWTNWDVNPDLAKQKSQETKKESSTKKKKKGGVKHPKSYY